MRRSQYRIMAPLFSFAVVLSVGLLWWLSCVSATTDSGETNPPAPVSIWTERYQTSQQTGEPLNSYSASSRLEGKFLDSGLRQTTSIVVTNVTFTETWRAAITRGDVLAVQRNKHAKSGIRSACLVDPFLDCSNMGLSALLLQTMEALAYCHNTLGSIPTVMWRNCFAGCSRDPSFNSWSWYFEPINPGVELRARKVACIANISPESGAPVWLSASFRSRKLAGYSDHDLITNETRQAAHDIIRRFIKPSREITRIVEELYARHLHGYNLLGIHVRGTDHISETKDFTLPTIKMWIEEARQILASIPTPSKIFIAADNSEVLEAFKKEFGEKKVYFTKALRAKFYHQRVPPHEYAGTHDTDQMKFGSEVLIDALLLARCQHFLHAEASVSNLAVFFNPLLKSHFLGELSKKNRNVGLTEKQRQNDDELLPSTKDDMDSITEYKRCLLTNGPSSSCPNMAAGKLSQPLQVQRFLSGYS